MICPNPSCARDLPQRGLEKLWEPAQFLWWRWSRHAGDILACPACGHIHATSERVRNFRPFNARAARPQEDSQAPAAPTEDPREKLLRQAMTRESLKARGPLKAKDAPPV